MITEQQRREIRQIVHGDPDKPVVLETSVSGGEDMGEAEYTEHTQERRQHMEINADKVIERLAAKVAELTRQVAVLETYIEQVQSAEQAE